VVVLPPPDLAEQVQVVRVSPDEVINRRSEQGSTR